MNCAYRLIWNEQLNAWVVAPEIASARGKRGQVKRSAAALMLTLAIGAHAALAADLAATALPGGGQISAGQATISSNGAAMTINQGSQRAIINWQNFDIGSQASVNFQQPNTSAVTLNRAGGPTASRIEGRLTANGQVFLINPNGVLFGSGARVNVGGLVASTLNIRDNDFLSGNYVFSGDDGSIINQGQITAAPGGYLAFISPSITNNGTISAPQGTVAMGAGERVRLNFAGDRLVGLDVSASAIDTLITNNQAIRAEGGAILLTAAGAESVTHSVINNTGVLEASSLNLDGGRIVLTAGNDINLGAASTVAVDGKKGGEITVQAQSGTLLADGALSARGGPGTGGTVRLLGHQVGLVNVAQIDASGATGGGTVNIGGSRQGTGPLASSRAVFIGADTRIDASATANGDGGTVVVYADDAARIYGHLSARGGPQGGHGGFIETSGKQYLDVLRTPDATALAGRGGEWLIDPNNIQIVTTAGTCTSLSGCAAGPNWATTNDSAQLGVNLINNALNLGQSVTVTTTTSGTNTQPGNITFQAGANIAKTAGGDATVTLSAHNDINTTGATISSTTGRLNVVLAADSELSGVGNVVVGGNVTTLGGSLTATGVGISGAGAINTTGGASTNGGNITITGTSAAGSINLTGAMTTTGGTATAGSAGRSAGNITINGAGAVTTGAITASGSNGNGANQAGGSGGAIAVTSNGTLLTGNLAASGGNGGTGTGSVAAGGNAGSIAVTNNSTTAGALTTGTLTARAGIARGAIVSGTAGSVNVTNRAATLLRTGAIDTRGQTGGAGGSVSMSSVGDVTVTGTIATSGAALVAGTTATGRNAGNVTITGVNRSVTGAITASGAAGLGTNQAGGNAGLVSITGSGALSTLGIAAQTSAATGTGSGGMVGGITLNGTSVSTGGGGLTTTGGANGNGGNISVTSTAGTLAVGAVSASGGTANTGTAGRNAGTVTLNSAGTVTATTIAANGTAGLGANANQTGGNGAAISITGVGGVTTTAIGASGGAATTTNANGGNAGSITINNSGSGNISTTTLNASTGAATGTGNGGNAGFISVTNAAANGNLTTRAITTTGGAKGNGGNVTLSALGAVSTTNSNIITSGGAGIGSAGRNAGTITISGGGVNLGTGTVTANGGNGNGADQAGGSGAAVQITSTNGIAANGAINATGGNGVTGNAAGGNSGSINIANSGAGTIQTGALAARNGAAAGTGASGTVGGISVSNTAGNVTLGALTTSGQANGNGGNINVNATGLLTLNGAIATSGGTNVALTTQAGKNAGTINLSGNGITSAAAATIAANGNAGLGTNQAGGNAGLISITGTGTGAIALNTGAAITSSTGAATGTGAGGAVGGITVSAPSITSTGALTTTGGANGNGGNVSVTTTSGNLNVGAIATSGGAANAGTAGRNAGNVTINGAGAIATAAITANGLAGNGANQAGGNGGNISLDAGGATPLVTIGGNLSALGGDRTGTGVAGAGGNITVADTLNIGAANRTISTRGGSTGVGAGGNITLGSSIYDDGGVRSLTVTGGSGVVTVAGGTANATLANNLDTLVVTASDGAGKIRVGSVKTVAAQSYDAGTGAIELNGNVATLGSAGADTVTFSDPVTLTGNSSITTAGGSGDNIALSQTVNGAFGLTLNAGATGNVSTSAAIGGSTPLTAFSATGAAVTFGQSVTAGSIFARSTFGNLTLNAGTVLTGTGIGNAIELVAIGAASRFVNNAGAGALNASNGAGRFLVWSQNPALDNRGGLAYAFKQYNATYPTTVLGTGNGFLYALAPTITPGLTGTVSKEYDATTSATLLATNFTPTSGVDGDVITMSGTGTYDNANVAGSPTKLVTATGIAATVTSSVADGSKPVYGYTLTSTTANANIGEITPAPLTITGNTTNSVYTSNLQTNGFATSGLLGSDSVTSVATLASGTNVGTYADNLTSATGTGLANYTIGFVNGSLTITPAPLTITGNTTNSLYTSNLQTNTFSTTGLLGSDSVTSVATLASGTNVGTYADNLTSATGTGLTNYTIGYVNGSLTITPAPLTITGNTTSSLYTSNLQTNTFSTTGLLGSDSVTSVATLASGTNVGTYADNLTSATGSGLTNYTIGYVNGSLTITPAPLTITGGTTSSLYTAAAQTNTFSTAGLLGSDTVTSVAVLGSGTNVGTYADNLTSATGTGLTNYTIGYVNGSLTITPAPLTITANDAQRPIDTPNPPFSATYAGFVGGETPAVLNGVLSFSTPATLTSPVGIYPITPYGQSSDNYAIAYLDGDLTVYGAPVITPTLPREVVSQQAIGAQYTDPTMPSDVLTGLQFIFEDKHDATDEKLATSVVRVVGSGIRLPN